MKKILFFDCETNGLPIDYKASYTEVDNWPRVISLAWLLTDETGQTLTSGSYLIKPDGWQMPTEEFWVNNGYTHAKSEELGLPIGDVLQMFLAAKMEADILVAHNLNFDHRIVWAEFIRNGMEPRSGLHKICTMMKSTNVCKLPGKRGYKWPKLEDLYEFLFRKPMENAHDALADVTACMECFFALLAHGAVSLEIPEKSNASSFSINYRDLSDKASFEKYNNYLASLDQNYMYEFLLFKMLPVRAERYPGLPNSPLDLVGVQFKESEPVPIAKRQLTIREVMSHSQQILNPHGLSGFGKYYLLANLDPSFEKAVPLM